MANKFLKKLKESSGVIAIILTLSGLLSSGVFYYLDNRYDQRYLQLLEITKTLDPLYISIAAAKEQQRIERITVLDHKIWELNFRKNSLPAGEKLPPYEATNLEKYNRDIQTLREGKK